MPDGTASGVGGVIKLGENLSDILIPYGWLNELAEAQAVPANHLLLTTPA